MNGTLQQSGQALPSPLQGRTVYVPQMSHGGAIAFAAAFRSVGIEARVCPEATAETLELAGRHTSGDECFPARITLGSFLSLVDAPEFDPARTAFFMPTSDGPCRFGQYAPYLRLVLRNLRLDQVLVFSPTSRDGYLGLGSRVTSLMRTAFRGLVASDALRKLLHRTRPYEISRGDTDHVHARAIASIERVLERPDTSHAERMDALTTALAQARDEFGKVPARYHRERPLIGVVGEIFCRLTPFSNHSLIRKLEDEGAECTLSHIVEWVSYTNAEHQKRLRRSGQRWTVAMASAKLKDAVQHHDERRIHQVFADDFVGYEDPPVRSILQFSAPYLPHERALGEMTLSVGKAVAHYHQACDAVVDISPFGCMNGIVTEAVYPRVSRDHDGIPIRSFFFDGVAFDLDRDIGILIELARSYRARKKVTRKFPRCFE